MSAADDSTLRGMAPIGRLNRILSRMTLSVLLIVVAAGAVGALGVHTSATTSTSHGYTLDVAYPRIARAGLDVEWEVTVTNPGGFTDDITLTVSADYFGMFETQGFFPEPSDTTRDGDRLFLTFAKPPGDTLVVGYDAYVQPSSQRGSSATVSVLDNGSPAATVQLKTTLLP